MKQIIIIFLLAVTSAFAQSQFKTGDAITTEDKLRFLDSLNKYRNMYGIPELKYSFKYESFSVNRIETIRNHIKKISYEECRKNLRKHLHINAMEDFCKFNIFNLPADTTFTWKGECTLSANNGYVLEKKLDIITEIFTAWKGSPDHWNNMLDPNFQYITLAFEYKDGIIISVLNSFDLERSSCK